MDKFSDNRVLALKYRPKKFSQLIGQDAVARTLSLALDTKRLSHAYLFSGLRGSGKTSSARIFSKCLNCDHGPTSEPCEVCVNCVNANEGRHIDIIEMDAASSRSINDIRELIEQTKYKPSIGRYKIFIIDEVHMLTKEAFNALLKTLEEPPSYIKFILATTDPLKLPPTILSRTQHYRFKKISKYEVIRHLEFILNNEKIAFEKEALEILARNGGGSLRDTLTLLDQAIIFSKGAITSLSVAEMLGIVDPEFISELFDAVFEKNELKIKEYLKELSSYEAEMLIQELIAYLKERFDQSDPRFSMLILDRFFRILSEAKSLLALSMDEEFVLSLMFLKLIEALKVKEIDAMIAEIEDEIAKKPTFIPKIDSDTKIELSAKIGDNRFDELINKIYNRSYDLGECFKKNVAFVSFENRILTWKSKADGECRKLLGSSFGIIKQLVREVYGEGVEIKKEIWMQEHQDISDIKSKNETNNNEQNINIVSKDSHIEVKEKDVKNILEHPLIERAKELFGADMIEKIEVYDKTLE